MEEWGVKRRGCGRDRGFGGNEALYMLRLENRCIVPELRNKLQLLLQVKWVKRLTGARLSGSSPPSPNHSTYSLPSVPLFSSFSFSIVLFVISGRSFIICLPSGVIFIFSCSAGRKIPAVDSEREAMRSPRVTSRTPTTPEPTARRAFWERESGIWPG